MNDTGVTFGILLCILLAVGGVLIINASRNNRSTLIFQVKLFLIAIAVRFALSIVLYGFGFSKVLGDEDSSGWLIGSFFYGKWVTANVGLLTLPSTLLGAFDGNHLGYSYMVGALFFITGIAARLPAAVLNCFFGALTVIVAYRAAATLFSYEVAKRVAWMTCLFPSMIIWSAQTVKEPVVIFIEMIALYGCLRLKRHGFSLRDILLCGIALVAVIPFRFYAAYIIAAAVALSLILPQFGKRKFTLTSAMVLAAVVVPIVLMSGVLVQHEKQFENFDLKYVEKFKKDVSVGSTGAGSGVSTNYDLETPGGFSMAVLIGGAHLLLAPFPWQLGGGSLRMILTLPELLVWWWLFFIGVVPGFWHTVRHRFGDVMPVLIFLFGLGLLYSMMFGNVGLVFRQRAQLLPWLFIFAAVGLELRLIKRLTVRQPKNEMKPGTVTPLTS
jgi:4-amino-4-deoxy-L-arabinose transferase-like glycosyltransferase